MLSEFELYTLLSLASILLCYMTTFLEKEKIEIDPYLPFLNKNHIYDPFHSPTSLSLQPFFKRNNGNIDMDNIKI